MQSLLKKVRLYFVKRERETSDTKLTTDVGGLVPAESLEDVPIVNGYVSLHNDKLTVHNPNEYGSFATIEVPRDPRIAVTVDEQLVVGRVIVHQSQDIHVHLHHVQPRRKLSFIVSKDEMTVIGRAFVTEGEEYHLRESTSTRHLVIDVDVTKVYPSPMPTEKILDLLVQLAGYHGDIDEQALFKLSAATRNAEFPLVTGRTPIPAEPDTYKQVDLPKMFDPNPRHRRFPTIPMGTTIAVVEKGRPGIPGQNVYGHPVNAPSEKAPELGEGVTEIAGHLVALRSGRLCFTNNKIDVIPELVVNHSLTSRDGKIEFDGNVIIRGAVLDGSFIRATGHVDVYGDVLCSTVMGERGVFVENLVVGSTVISGQSKLIYKSVLSTLQTCAHELKRFADEYGQLLERAETLPDCALQVPFIAGALLAKRHTVLETALHELCNDQYHLSQNDIHYSEIVKAIRSKWTGIGITGLDQDDVQRLHKLIVEYKDHVETMASADAADIKATEVTSSVLRSSGRIKITGSIVYASTFESEESIIVKGNVRGGFLIAQNMIKANELGTPSGTETSAKVLSQSGRIVVNTRHPNTLLQVGSSRNQALNLEHRVLYRGDEHHVPHAARG